MTSFLFNCVIIQSFLFPLSLICISSVLGAAFLELKVFNEDDVAKRARVAVSEHTSGVFKCQVERSKVMRTKR